MQYSVIMNIKKEEKNLGGMMDCTLVDRFIEQTESRGFIKKRALAGVVKLWLQIPEDLQSRIINEDNTDHYAELDLKKAETVIKQMG